MFLLMISITNYKLKTYILVYNLPFVFKYKYDFLDLRHILYNSNYVETDFHLNLLNKFDNITITKFSNNSSNYI